MLRNGWVGSFCLVVLVSLLLGGCSLVNSTSAVIDVSALQGTVPLTISYDASASVGPDGITTYRWAFGDATEIYGASGSHTFNHAGVFEVELTIRAADGSVDTETVSIVVEPAFWVADENLNEIYKLDSSGNVIQTLQSPVTQPRGLRSILSLESCWQSTSLQAKIQVVSPTRQLLLGEFGMWID